MAKNNLHPGVPPGSRQRSRVRAESDVTLVVVASSASQVDEVNDWDDLLEDTSSNE